MAALTLVSGSRAGAEDAVQEALARAWERSERGERLASPSAWVIVVATNLARSTWRRRRAEARARDRLGDPSAAGAAQADQTDIDVRRALDRLPRRQREVVVLHYYLGLPVADVAAAAGVSEGTVKTSLHRARRSLAAALGEVEPEEANDRAGS